MAGMVGLQRGRVMKDILTEGAIMELGRYSQESTKVTPAKTLSNSGEGT